MTNPTPSQLPVKVAHFKTKPDQPALFVIEDVCHTNMTIRLDKIRVIDIIKASDAEASGEALDTASKLRVRYDDGQEIELVIDPSPKWVGVKVESFLARVYKEIYNAKITSGDTGYALVMTMI